MGMNHPPPPVGVRIWSDGRTKDSAQSLASSVVSIVTLTLYTGWLHILLALLVASVVSRGIALAVTLAILGTVFLPAKPVLW